MHCLYYVLRSSDALSEFILGLTAIDRGGIGIMVKGIMGFRRYKKLKVQH